MDISDFSISVLGKKFKKIIFFVVLLVIGYMTVIHFEKVTTIFTEHFSALVYAIFMTLIAFAIQTYNFLQLLHPSNKVPYFRALHTWGTANLANYLGPFQPGIAVRLVYFKSMGVSVNETTHASVRQLMISLWLASGISVVGLFSEYMPIKLFAITGILIFILMPIMLQAASKFIDQIGSNSRFFVLLRTVLDLDKIGVSPYKMWSFIAQYILGALVLYGVYHMFDIPIALHESILMAVLFMLSSLFSVTPNNLGIQELLIGYVAHLGGAAVATALSIALLFRVAHITSCLIIMTVTSKD